jgi:hypothetical protein
LKGDNQFWVDEVWFYWNGIGRNGINFGWNVTIFGRTGASFREKWNFFRITGSSLGRHRPAVEEGWNQSREVSTSFVETEMII